MTGCFQPPRTSSRSPSRFCIQFLRWFLRRILFEQGARRDPGSRPRAKRSVRLCLCNRIMNSHRESNGNFSLGYRGSQLGCELRGPRRVFLTNSGIAASRLVMLIPWERSATSNRRLCCGDEMHRNPSPQPRVSRIVLFPRNFSTGSNSSLWHQRHAK